MAPSVWDNVPSEAPRHRTWKLYEYTSKFSIIDELKERKDNQDFYEVNGLDEVSEFLIEKAKENDIYKDENEVSSFDSTLVTQSGLEVTIDNITAHRDHPTRYFGFAGDRRFEIAAVDFAEDIQANIEVIAFNMAPGVLAEIHEVAEYQGREVALRTYYPGCLTAFSRNKDIKKYLPRPIRLAISQKIAAALSEIYFSGFDISKITVEDIKFQKTTSGENAAESYPDCLAPNVSVTVSLLKPNKETPEKDLEARNHILGLLKHVINISVPGTLDDIPDWKLCRSPLDLAYHPVLYVGQGSTNPLILQYAATEIAELFASDPSKAEGINIPKCPPLPALIGRGSKFCKDAATLVSHLKALMQKDFNNVHVLNDSHPAVLPWLSAVNQVLFKNKRKTEPVVALKMIK